MLHHRISAVSRSPVTGISKFRLLRTGETEFNKITIRTTHTLNTHIVREYTHLFYSSHRVSNSRYVLLEMILCSINVHTHRYEKYVENVATRETWSHGEACIYKDKVLVSDGEDDEERIERVG